MPSSRTIVAALAAMLLAATWARASINYGNFGPVAPGVFFTNVTESSPTDPLPLYGPPSVFAVGLNFNPILAASSQGGGVDLTDGQLNFTVDSLIGLNAISLFESGDFSLSGVGTAVTQAQAGASLRVTVTAIDGVNVAPINLTPVNGSVGFNLPANAGLTQPWSLGLALDIQGQLSALSVPFNSGATRLEVVINNTVSAVSEPSSAALIAKKDFRVDVTPIPEPATAALLGLALCAAAMRRRR